MKLYGFYCFLPRVLWYCDYATQTNEISSNTNLTVTSPYNHVHLHYICRSNARKFYNYSASNLTIKISVQLHELQNTSCSSNSSFLVVCGNKNIQEGRHCTAHSTTEHNLRPTAFVKAFYSFSKQKRVFTNLHRWQLKLCQGNKYKTSCNAAT
jgi:hypothetical protein